MVANNKHTEDFQMENTIGFLVNRLSFVLRQEITKKLKKANLDITPEECVLLNKLWQNDGQRQNELAQATIRNQTTVTRIIDKMEKKNLVYREHSKEDRRQVLAWLTPEGKNMRNQVIPHIFSLLENAQSYVSKSDMTTTTTTLRKIINGMMDE